MNKLRLLREFNQSELFRCLSCDELRLFLFMVADCAETGEGEINFSQAELIFGKDFSQKRFDEICEELNKKGLISLICHTSGDTTKRQLAIMYRIMLPTIITNAGPE